MSCEQKLFTKYQGCLEFHTYLNVAVTYALLYIELQTFEIIEFEIPFALKLSAVVTMVLIHNNVILLIGASISCFEKIIFRMAKNTVRG